MYIKYYIKGVLCMSYQEKRTIVSTLTGFVILAAYCIFAYRKQQSGVIAEGDLKFWAGSMLMFVGIGIVASIIIQIVFHILMSISIAVKKTIRNESCAGTEIDKIMNSEMVEDEMDRLIGLKAMRVSFAIAGIGFMAGLGALLLDYSAAVMLNILFIAFSAGSLTEGISQLYYYRKGVTNG